MTHQQEGQNGVAGTLPDPNAEIRLTTLSATRGANYWSRRPITRLDLVVGVYDDISSAEIPGFTERLVAALPGLREHRCSIGERGGFVTRLHRGTYTPHIVEHVALELQVAIGHDVGYGRTRGGDVDGEYTIIFEHQHEAVGLRAAALALQLVQEAITGTLESADHALAELRNIADGPNVPPITPRVLCAVTGGSGRAGLRVELERRVACADELIVDVSPAFMLQAGLPYAESDVAVVLDADLADVPARYREADRAWRLVEVVADGIRRGGVLVAPAKAWDLQNRARDNGCTVAIFSAEDDITRRDKKVARSAAWMSGDRVIIEHRGEIVTEEEARDDLPRAVQVAAALAHFSLAQRGIGC